MEIETNRWHRVLYHNTASLQPIDHRPGLGSQVTKSGVLSGRDEALSNLESAERLSGKLAEIGGLLTGGTGTSESNGETVVVQETLELFNVLISLT